MEFPGYGDYVPGALGGLPGRVPEVRGVLDETDAALRTYGHGPLSGALTDSQGPAFEDLARSTVLMHVATFAVSAALYAALRARGVTGDILLGHSEGEYTALAAAGCLSVYDAVRLLCEREEAIEELGEGAGGGLTVLMADAWRAADLCRAAGGRTLQLSVFNSPGQTVVSGRTRDLDALESLARAMRLRVTRLLVPHPRHNPMLARAGHRLAAVMEDFTVHAPNTRLFSPVALRFVRDERDARTTIVQSLTDPVHHVEAVRILHDDEEAGTFIEVGVRPMLAGLTADCLPRGVKVVGPPYGAHDARQVLDALTVDGTRQAPGIGPVQCETPGPSPTRPRTSS
ncbi:ACP S-malonyltransferase [Streptomyces sp. NPDC059373]